MGAGIALECRLRYPEMFLQYQKNCEAGLINIGKLSIYKGSDHWILNFPTKKHWKYPSKEEYLKLGLEKFIATYHQKNITSAAFPLLGANNGGIPQQKSIEIMTSYLKNCEIPIEIYTYDPKAHDDLYEKFKEKFLTLSLDELKVESGLRIDIVNKIKDSISDNNVFQLNQLAMKKGIGDKTLEKVFRFVSKERTHQSNQFQLDLINDKQE
jgi:O-acetyl-ADP-ribose deacetylase (regulator of RNase III)